MRKMSLKQQAYNIIKNKIITCEYPPNFLLNEEKLKDEIGASRTPIRDALSRLEQENLVHILPKKESWLPGHYLSAKLMRFMKRGC